MIILIVNVNRSTLAQGLIHLFLSHLNTNVVQELQYMFWGVLSAVQWSENFYTISFPIPELFADHIASFIKYLSLTVCYICFIGFFHISPTNGSHFDDS